MISKSNKFIKYASIAAIAIVALAASLSSNNINLGKNILRGRAVEVIEGEIVFQNASSSTSSDTLRTTSSSTQTGSPIICKVINNVGVRSSGYVGAVENGSEIRFYESDGVTEYTFENLIKIRFDFGTNYMAFYLKGCYNNGSPIDLHYNSATGSSRTLNFATLGKVSNLWVSVDSSTGTISTISKITLTYSCESKYQTGLSILGEPVTEYNAGQKFDSSNLYAVASYSNGDTVATKNFAVYPDRALTTSDTSVDIRFGGFSYSIPVTVLSVSIAGTYTGTSVSFVFNSDLTGVYTYASSASLNFTYSLSNTNRVTFTFVSYVGSATESDFGSNRLFQSGQTTNSTGTFNYAVTPYQITLKVYNPFGSSTNKTITKA